jgi:WD40 repeat protein
MQFSVHISYAVLVLAFLSSLFPCNFCASASTSTSLHLQIKFWTLAKRKDGLHELVGQPLTGRFGKGGTLTITSVVWLPSGECLAGTSQGLVLTWKRDVITAQVQAHNLGAQVSRFDGPPGYHGVRCMVLKPDRKTLLTGGADGFVK